MHIPYDPDFDTSSKQNTSPSTKGGFFHNASPKLTFVFGLVLGLAIVSLIGLIILLI